MTVDYPESWGYLPDVEPAPPAPGLTTGSGARLPTHTSSADPSYPANWNTSPEPTPINYQALNRAYTNAGDDTDG